MPIRRPKLALAGLVGLLAVATASYGAPLVEPNAPITGTELYGVFHPGAGAVGQPTFNLYGGTDLDPPTSPTAELDTTFADGGISGTVNSKVYDMGGAYLFVYTFAFDTTSRDVSNGNLTGYDGVAITDSGLLTSSSTHAAGDLVRLFRSGDTVGFDWKYVSLGALPPLGVDTTSFYLMTDATTYGQSAAALISPDTSGGGGTASGIAVLSPVPEPATMAVLAMGAVVAVVRRRRR